jgi:Tol biopolymer transport system component
LLIPPDFQPEFADTGRKEGRLLMSGNLGKRELPQLPHPDHLRKQAKARLAEMKARVPSARLADAQFVLAREYGFANWAALQAEVGRRMLHGPRMRGPVHAVRGLDTAYVGPCRPITDDLPEFAAPFLHAAAAAQIGFLFAALVGVAMVWLFTFPANAQPSDAMSQRRAEQALPRTAIAFDTKAFDKFVGFYHMPANLRPNTVITVTRDGEHFLVQLSRQPAREVLPESPTEFFFKGIPAQVSFETDAQGKAASLVLHQAGLDVTAPRIDEAIAKRIEAAPMPPQGHPMPHTWPTLAGIVPRSVTAATGGSMDYWPCFSPDGKTVLFSRTMDSGKNWTLYRVAVEGGRPDPITLPVSATRADWSRDNRIAFTATMNGGNSVWVMASDGGGAHEIAAQGHQLFYPSWYPGGKSLAVLDGAASVIRRLDLTNGSAAALTDSTQVLTGMPSVSPDGKSIAFAGQKNKGQPYNQEENVVWLVQDGGALRPLETVPLQGRAPVWSPDGNRIAFESDRGSSDGRYAIFIINRDGTGLVQVTDYALNATHPVFSPDGKRMVFAQGVPPKDATIAVIDLPAIARKDPE